MRASPSQNTSPQGLSDKMRANSLAPESRREMLVAAVFILFSSVSFLLIQYDRMRTQGPSLEAWFQSVRSGSDPAPNQYRIALPFLTHFLELHAHLRVNQSLPLIEFVAYAAAFTLLYLLFRDSPRVRNAPLPMRLSLLGLFLAAAQFPTLWIFPWDRPETLPTTFYLAAVVLLVLRNRVPLALTCIAVVFLSLGQALMRADVPFLAGIAIFLAAAAGIPFTRPRAHMATLGLLCSAVGGATQLYLQRIAYPNATYPPTTSKIELLNNLNLIHPPNHVPIFLTALLPFLFSLYLVRRYRLPLEPSDKLVLLMSLIYLPLWVTTGLVVEVRIFVPFLFLASPTVAKIWAGFLSADTGAV